MPESEKSKARRAAWAKAAYAADPEKFRAYAREQRHKHKDKYKEKAAAYRAANKERLRAQNRMWREANPDKLRRNNLKRIGYTPELFDELLAAQNGLCAICDADLSAMPSKNVHADHCHTTLEPRGILCHHCNSAIGLLGESPERMMRAIAYLDEPTMKRRKA